MSIFTWVGASALAVIIALWAADHSRQRLDAKEILVGTLQQELRRVQAQSQKLTEALTNQAALQKQLTEVRRAARQMNIDIEKQSRVQNLNLEELKYNDEQVAKYLDNALPPALGLRYARPETTDPIHYRAAALRVHVGALHFTGSTPPEK